MRCHCTAHRVLAHHAGKPGFCSCSGLTFVEMFNLALHLWRILINLSCLSEGAVTAVVSEYFPAPCRMAVFRHEAAHSRLHTPRGSGTGTRSNRFPRTEGGGHCKSNHWAPFSPWLPSCLRKNKQICGMYHLYIVDTGSMLCVPVGMQGHWKRF